MLSTKHSEKNDNHLSGFLDMEKLDEQATMVTTGYNEVLGDQQDPKE